MEKDWQILKTPNYVFKTFKVLLVIFILYVLLHPTTTLSECAPSMEPRKITVTATMYEPLESQTDDTPNLTADGTRISIKHAGKYRYLAVSRDLLEIVNYGDYVVIEGINGKYDGVWQIKDTMHPRWSNRVDLLVNPGTPPFRKDSAIMTIYN